MVVTNVIVYTYIPEKSTEYFIQGPPTGFYVTWTYTGTATFTIIPYINDVEQPSLITTSSLTNKIFTNLTVNQTYTFRVKATSGGITSELSIPSLPKTYLNNIIYNFSSGAIGRVGRIPKIGDGLTLLDIIIEPQVYMIDTLVTITSFLSEFDVNTTNWGFENKVKSIYIPDTVTSLPSFQWSKHITSIRFPKNITTIGYSFREVGLEIVDLSYTSLTNIDPWAFHANENLKKITLPGSLTALGAQTFTDVGKQVDSVLFKSSALDVFFYGSSIPTLTGNNFTGPGSFFPTPCRAFYLPGTTNVSRLTNHVNTARGNAPIFTQISVFIPIPTNVSAILYQSADDEFVSGLVINWESVYNASKYYINIYNSSTDTTPVKIITKSSSGFTYTITGDDNLPSGEYFISVQSRSDTDNISSEESTRTASVIFNVSLKFKIINSLTAFVNGNNNTSLTSIYIPSSITIDKTLYKVTKIGDSIFKNLSTLTTVNLPSNIENLGISSFENCINLTNINFPNSLISIDNFAFKNCRKLTTISLSLTGILAIKESIFDNCLSLTSITLPTSVSNINTNSFINCVLLTTLNISANNNSFITENGILYNKGKTSLLFYPSNIQNLTFEIPSTVLNIGNYCFYDNIYLRDLNFNASIQTVGQSVFNNENLNMIFYFNIPYFDTLSFVKPANIAYKLSSTTNLNNLLTNNFAEIKTISAPININLIPYIETSGSDISGIYVSWTNSVNLITSMNISLYKSSEVNPLNIFNIVNPAGLTSYLINTNLTFNQTYKIQINITIPTGQVLTSDFSSTLFYSNVVKYNKINNIGIVTGFNGNPTQLNVVSEIRIENNNYNVISLDSYCFRNCPSATSVILPNTITTIDTYAFENCTSLTSITIPTNILYIKKGAFKNCPGLTSLTLPSTISIIDEETFMNCSGLTVINLPSVITKISINAFNGCSNLTSFSIPNSLNEIEPKIFYNCPKLSQFIVASDNTKFTAIDGIIFNKTITKLMLFPMGKNVTTFNIPNGVTEIGNYAFQHCNKLTDITLNSVTKIGIDAFHNCIFTSINIPDNLITIENGAFSFCSNLISFSVSASHTIFSVIDGILFSKNLKKICNYPVGKPQTSYSVPNSVEEIGASAFQSAQNLTNITFLNTLKKIGDAAFQYCINFTTITIPTTVTTIGTNAFADIPGLRLVYQSSGSLVFNLPSLNIVISSDLVKILEDDGVNLTGDVVVNIEIEASVINNTFVFKTLTPNLVDLTNSKYKVSSINNNYDGILSNTQNTFITYDGGITSGYIGPNDSITTLPYEYLCYVSHIKNNTTNGVRGILQVNSFLSNMNNKIDNAFKSVLQGLSEVEQGYSDSLDIISLSILKEVAINDSSRLLHIEGTSIGNNWYPNLVQPGDYLYYTLTIEPNPNQTGITNNRIYLYKAKII
jgi:hypothetical protein